jgi:hypothetical protein
MKTLLLATAAVCAAVAATPSHAVDLEYHSVKSTDLSCKIGMWYELTPKELKAKMYNPRVIVVGDNATLAKMQRATNAPASDIKKFANEGFVAVAYNGLRDGRQPRSIMFNESNLLKNREAWQRHTVIHEMMHLFDGGPPAGVNPPRISERPDFVAAWKADKADFAMWLKTLPADQREMFSKRMAYYTNSPVEAFATAGALLIWTMPSEDYGLFTQAFNKAFPRITQYVSRELAKANVPMGGTHVDESKATSTCRKTMANGTQEIIHEKPVVAAKEPVVGNTWQSPEVKAASEKKDGVSPIIAQRNWEAWRKDQAKLNESASSSEVEGLARWCIAQEYKPEQCGNLPREYAKEAWCELKGRKGDKPLTCLVEE